MTRLAEENITGLEITVQDASPVRRSQASDELMNQIEAVRRRHACGG